MAGPATLTMTVAALPILGPGHFFFVLVLAQHTFHTT